MRKNALIVISALVTGLLFAEMRTSAVTGKAGEASLAGVEKTSPIATPQNVPFVWVLPNEEGDYPGYKRVEGGKLDDGTRLDICRAQTIPGKVYNNLCLYPYAGAEGTFRFGYYQVLLTNAQFTWKSADNVTRAEIK